MMANPLMSELGGPTLRIVGGLLGTILLVILGIERRPWRELVGRPLFRRWATWAVIAPLFGLAVLTGPLAAALLTMLLSLQCLREYSALVELPASYRRVLLGTGALAAPAALLAPGLFFGLPPLLLVLATLLPLVHGEPRAGMRHLPVGVFGWGYLAWLPAFLVLLHQQAEGGPRLLLVIGLAVALSDVGAFAVGKLAGRRPLAPRLSPGKTVEGVAGALAGALAGVLLLTAIWPSFLTLPAAVGLALVIGLGAVWGDLVESALKRAAGAKDAGAWLPGFGGLLDRADSLILVLPLVYYALPVLRLLAGG